MKLSPLRPFDPARGFGGLRRLRGRKVCERVLRRGQVWRGKHMRITYVRGEPWPEKMQRHSNEELRMQNEELGKLLVGTVASTKLEKSAVKRNRMRRRCREAVRVSAQQLASEAPRADARGIFPMRHHEVAAEPGVAGGHFALRASRLHPHSSTALRPWPPAESGDNWPVTAHVLISPRSSSLTCNFEELLRDAENFLRHLER